MPLIPLSIQQGATIPTFILTTFKTKPLGVLIIFTIADWAGKKINKNKHETTKNMKFFIGVVGATILTGPFIIYWSEEIFHYINDKMVNITDDFFNYTSALGV